MARIREVGPSRKLSAEFDSVPEVFRAIDKLGWVPQRGKESDSQGNSGGFYTFKSLAEAIETFRHHPERIRGFSMKTDRLEVPDTPGKDVSYDVTGDYLDVDRFLEGIPEVFGNAVMGNPKTIFATINVLGSFVSYTDKNYVLHKQKRILRLVDWLESQGIRCQLIVSDDSEVAYISTIVKEFSDPFDVNHVAVAMHPDWLRRVEFLIMEQSKTWQHGYGSAIEYDKRMLAYEPKPEDGLYIYVGGYIPHKNHSLDALDADFDRIEQSVTQMIADGMTFNEKPLVSAGGTLKW